jgi:hypothetical protein
MGEYNNQHDDLDAADQVKVMAWNAVAQKNEQIAALKVRITELESELAGCRACREKIDCISRGEAFQSPSRRYERPKS